jgi:LPS-assembly lipoprotein
MSRDRTGKMLDPRLGGDDEPAGRSGRGRLIAALALSGGLVACGFRLRGTQQLPFESIFIGAPATSSLGIELARGIRAGTATRVSAERAAAQAQLELISENREREVLSVNAQGRAREYLLRLRVVFRVHDGKGREFIAPTEISATRDLAVSEAQILARESEETQLYLDMQTDLVQQMLRRLSVLKP